MRLTARYVAWYEDFSCRDQVGWNIKVRAFTPNSKSRVYPTGRNPCGTSCADFGIGPARQLALEPHGIVAWISEDTVVGATHDFEVWKARPGDRSASRLARDPHISPDHLSIVNGRARWLQAGQPHSG